MELPYDPAILLLGIHQEKMKTVIKKDACLPTFIAALFTIAKIWMQPVSINWQLDKEDTRFYIYIYIFFLNKFIYLFLGVLGLRFCARAFSSCGARGPLFIAARGPLTVTASLAVEHRLQTRRLSSCGSQA